MTSTLNSRLEVIQGRFTFTKYISYLRDIYCLNELSQNDEWTKKQKESVSIGAQRIKIELVDACFHWQMQMSSRSDATEISPH